MNESALLSSTGPGVSVVSMLTVTETAPAALTGVTQFTAVSLSNTQVISVDPKVALTTPVSKKVPWRQRQRQ